MLPVKKDITIYAGDTFQFIFKVRDRKLNGMPGSYLDLTGSTCTAQIRQTEDDATSMADFDTEVTDEGQVTISLAPAVTAALPTDLPPGVAPNAVPPGQIGLWDAEIAFPDGTVKTFFRGKVYLKKDITRA